MKWLKKGLFLLGLGLLVFGLLSGGMKFVWSRAAALCLSCMGLD